MSVVRIHSCLASLTPNFNADPLPMFFFDLIALILILFLVFKFFNFLTNWIIELYELSLLPSSTKIISILKFFFFLKNLKYD